MKNVFEASKREKFREKNSEQHNIVTYYTIYIGVYQLRHVIDTCEILFCFYYILLSKPPERSLKVSRLCC
jgi:hypothetical protein